MTAVGERLREKEAEVEEKQRAAEELAAEAELRTESEQKLKKEQEKLTIDLHETKVSSSISIKSCI